MPSSKEIRRRIKSIRSTRQITKAMELVSAAKMRRAQTAARQSRAYAKLTWELIQNLGSKIHSRFHALLHQPKIVRRLGLILITSNRGLIGGFNNRVVQAALDYGRNFTEVKFLTLGKKGREAVRKLGYEIFADFEKKDAVYSTAEILPLASLVVKEFSERRFDRVAAAYMDFQSTLIQNPNVAELLPIVKAPDPSFGRDGLYDEELEASVISAYEGEYIFEPNPDEVLEVLLPRLLEMQIYQAVVETNASEHSARMVAMKNASDAAADLAEDLTLEYNQLRQATITKEISEIMAGQVSLG